eukprot:SAG11_NODE_199_length_12635_cov_104.801771_5_plen_393_part_01
MRLKARDDIVFVDADKNLGIVCLDKADYIRRAEEELQQTHTLQTDADAEPLATTRAEMQAQLTEPALSLPLWAQKWVSALLEAHPRTGAVYTLPNFRLTIKVHKSPIEGRPITGNQRWITQPLAELVANLLKPYVDETPVFTRDTDQINQELHEQHISAGAYLLTYDVVRLYPSIPHELCYTLLRRHLRACGCGHVAFLIAALRIILNCNYCTFNGRTWRQHTGFATGIACGAEVANLFVFVLTRFVFARYSEHIFYHRRFIDDGFIIWTGTRAQAEMMFSKLNALNTAITLTFTISLTCAVFLDLNILKGERYKACGCLDTTVFQKAVNRYLYTPFNSEHPWHCRIGLVHGELRRYIKRCSARADYIEIATEFRQRLHLRGYPFCFLSEAFA